MCFLPKGFTWVIIYWLWCFFIIAASFVREKQLRNRRQSQNMLSHPLLLAGWWELMHCLIFNKCEYLCVYMPLMIGWREDVYFAGCVCVWCCIYFSVIQQQGNLFEFVGLALKSPLSSHIAHGDGAARSPSSRPNEDTALNLAALWGAPYKHSYMHECTLTFFTYIILHSSLFQSALYTHHRSVQMGCGWAMVCTAVKKLIKHKIPKNTESH